MFISVNLMSGFIYSNVFHEFYINLHKELLLHSTCVFVKFKISDRTSCMLQHKDSRSLQKYSALEHLRNVEAMNL